MNLLSQAKKTFNLLSIGQRGVGKTVFLAGSYAELHGNSLTERRQQLWFDCQDKQVQENIDSILSYVVQTGQYPPPTMKITNFSFSLKQHRLSHDQTLCHFRWWDIPGEICDIHNVNFRNMVFNSHGCCMFIDAHALIHSNAYLNVLEDIIEQVTAIASLVSLNHLKYAFAVVLTKCDLLEQSPLTRQQIKQGLQPLTSRLDAVKVNYQTFYSLIPIVRTEGTSTLSPTGAAAPFLWLVWELSKAHNPGLMSNLVELVSLARPSGFEPQQEAADASLQSLLKPIERGAKVKKILGLYLLPTTLRNLLLLALAIVASVGVIGLLSVDYKWGFQQQPKNLDDLSNIATLQQRGQFDQAVRLMEKLVQQQPERLDLRLQLAELYEILGQVTKAETAYDQVLARQQNNIKALIGKAMLRKAQGDITTAKTLFLQAESAAPANLKAQVHTLAQKALQPTARPTLSPK